MENLNRFFYFLQRNVMLDELFTIIKKYTHFEVKYKVNYDVPVSIRIHDVLITLENDADKSKFIHELVECLKKEIK